VTDQPRSSEILALTSLRAVAALLVFVYHFPPSGLGRVVEVITAEGHVGVTVFFVLSGFLITVRYFPSFAAGGAGLADYFVRRAARILPLYFVVLTLSFVLTEGAVPADREHLPEWTLTHALFGSSVEGATIPTAWSLTVEECFYATAPLVFLAIAASRRRRGGAAGAIAVLAGVSALFMGVGALVQRGAASAGAPVP
jgi:peptidoglycan/LPS O-acetylase OafA/YrhL